MPATDYGSSSAPFSSLGRSFLSIRRDQVTSSPSGDQSSPSPLDVDLDSFQRNVADLFLDLSAADNLLSLPWLHSLLDAFLVCQERFRAAVLLSPHARPLLPRPPLDRLLSDSLDRSLKALDLCNAVRDGIHHLRLLQSHLRIALSALAPSYTTISHSHLRRARRALADFTIASLDDPKDNPSSHRNRSFGRNPASPATDRNRFRSLSWSVSRSWSANKQLQVGFGRSISLGSNSLLRVESIERVLSDENMFLNVFSSFTN